MVRGFGGGPSENNRYINPELVHLVFFRGRSSFRLYWLLLIKLVFSQKCSIQTLAFNVLHWNEWMKSTRIRNIHVQTMICFSGSKNSEREIMLSNVSTICCAFPFSFFLPHGIICKSMIFLSKSKEKKLTIINKGFDYAWVEPASRWCDRNVLCL